MIDAYEIGIQLLLQEDVSAGLAVVIRGLAEVDRAIAVTSANLVGLAKTSDAATKAIAAAVSGRATPEATIEPNLVGPVVPVVRGQPGKVAVTQPPIRSSEKTAAPEMKAAEPPTPAARPTSPSLKDEQSVPKPATNEQARSSNAPINSGTVEKVINDYRTHRTQIEAHPKETVSPVQVTPAAPRLIEPIPPATRAVATTAQGARRSATPSSARVALTASISRAQRQVLPPTQAQQARPKLTAVPTTQRESPVAPWSGVEPIGIKPGMARLHEAAVAPKSTGQDRSEPGGGTVMLDGRLVGQWLSEHMAREASRPPAGTSFFDPRQTPAWNVSGAL